MFSNQAPTPQGRYKVITREDGASISKYSLPLRTQYKIIAIFSTLYLVNFISEAFQMFSCTKIVLE